MKRYLVFTFDTYYPNGGMYDLKTTTNDIEHAKYVCDDAENGHVFDLVENRIVYET